MNAIDTNILIYALDTSEHEKSATAIAFLDELGPRDTVLPWQVLCEFAAVLLKLQRQGRCKIDPSAAIGVVRDRFPVIMPDPSILDSAMTLHRERQLSFWDAMLVAACTAAGVDRLFTEDLPGSAVIPGLTIQNPFASSR